MSLKPPVLPNAALDNRHVFDETSALPDRSGLAFQGALVTATDDSANDRVIVTVPQVLPVGPSSESGIDFGSSHKLYKLSTGGLQTAPAFGLALSLDGGLDAGGVGGEYRRFQTGITAINGTNGPRGDSITNDAANPAGASYFFPVYTNNGSFNTQGSYHGVTSYLTVNEVGGGGVYHEGLGYFSQVVSNSGGALTTPVELENVVNSGKAARSSAINLIVRENNTFADYTTTMGGASLWAKTGARGARIISGGSQPLGVGIAIEEINSNFLTALALFDNAAWKRFAIEGSGAQGSGALWWGPGGGAPDTNLYRSGVDQLKTDDTLVVGGASLYVLGNNVILGSGSDVNIYRANTDLLKTDDSFHVALNFRHLGANLGFFNTAQAAKQTVTGSRGGNAALASLLTALATYGLVTDSSSA